MHGRVQGELEKVTRTMPQSLANPINFTKTKRTSDTFLGEASKDSYLLYHGKDHAFSGGPVNLAMAQLGSAQIMRAAGSTRLAPREMRAACYSRPHAKAFAEAP